MENAKNLLIYFMHFTLDFQNPKMFQKGVLKGFTKLHIKDMNLYTPQIKTKILFYTMAHKNVKNQL